jgi:hypothetical protein
VAEAKSGFTLEAKLNSLKHERQVELGHNSFTEQPVRVILHSKKPDSYLTGTYPGRLR